MGIGAVIAAAGMSQRMGDFKPLMPVGQASMLQQICANFESVGVAPIVLVTGFRSDELEQHVAERGVICVHNEHFATTQMFDSLKIGLAYITGKCDRVFFTPADTPLFTVDTLKKLAASEGEVIKPSCNGKRGHPILLAPATVTKLLACENTEGLRGALRVCCDQITLVEVEDEGILYDADTPEDYCRLLVHLNTFT
jgi:CTP:molybdopterin cytidylyltransferase MocA